MNAVPIFRARVSDASSGTVSFETLRSRQNKGMKTNITSNWRPLLCALYAFPIAIAALWVVPRNAWAQLYVTKPLLPPGLLGVVSEYDPMTGASLNPKLIGGVSFPEALALNGDTLFVANGEPVAPSVCSGRAQ